MPVAGYDFELNGIKYNAAEDAEGEHYSLSGEPLRPPNAVTVQGERSNKFQMRPDTLLWTLTDWSGGEGQIKYNFQQPNVWRELTGVRVFDRPGTLQPGFYVEDTQDSTGAADFAVEGVMVIGAGGLYLLAHATNNAYLWDGSKWGAATSLTGVTNGASKQAAGDQLNLYWNEAGTDNVWKWPGTGSPAQIDEATGPDSTGLSIAELGPYVYMTRGPSSKVWEMSKNGSAEIEIDDYSPETSLVPAGDTAMAVLDGRVYVLVVNDHSTAVREILPTTAAGTGFGSEMARIPGFIGEAIWAHSGILYIFGRYGVTNRATVMYVAPGGEYGSLGRIRTGTALGEVGVGPYNGAMLEHYFAVEGATDALVFEIDSVGGNLACVAVNEDGDASGGSITGGLLYEGDFFFSTEGATTDRVMRARSDQYTKSSSAISAWHDFDLADEKILSSLVLSCEALPADWTINVDYAIDGSSSWATSITYTTDSGKGTKAAVSTDSATVKFRTLSIRIRMTYTGSGVPTSGPVVLGVDALAQVAKPQPVWRLLLDLADEKHRSGQGHSGKQKIANIVAAAEAEKVIAFKDGYHSHTPGVFEEYDVVIDQYAIMLSKPGEGVVAVTLKEVS